jgi:hypothetical protein
VNQPAGWHGWAVATCKGIDLASCFAVGGYHRLHWKPAASSLKGLPPSTSEMLETQSIVKCQLGHDPQLG